MIKIRSILAGIRSYSPWFDMEEYGAGSTEDAAYCYTVWLTHLLRLHETGISTTFDVVAELGPGNSLGVGVAALLTGASRYIALDTVPYNHNNVDVSLVDNLLEMFRSKCPVQYNDTVKFPEELFQGDRLGKALRPERLDSIRSSLRSNRGMIEYIAPWDHVSVIKTASVDFVLSHAVMEHVNDVHSCNRAVYDWLKPGGVASHVIDLRCHGISRKWNAHWACGDMLWKILKGNRPYFINRVPCSGHVAAMKDAGFEVKYISRITGSDGIGSESIARRFRGMDKMDLETSGVSLVGIHPLE